MNIRNRARVLAPILFLCLLTLSAGPSRAINLNFFHQFPDFPDLQQSGVQGSTMVWTFQMIPIDGLSHPVYFLAPLPARIQIYSVRTSRLVTTVMSDPRGRFKVSLRPGEYRLVPQTQYLNPLVDPKPGDLMPYSPRYQAAPVTIRVLPNSYKRVRIEYSLNQAV